MTLHATRPAGIAGDHVGWDAFLDAYAAKRRLEGPGFAWEVKELLGGDRHAAALLRLSSGRRAWRQVAVYRVDAGRIAEMWFYEDEADDDGERARGAPPGIDAVTQRERAEHLRALHAGDEPLVLANVWDVASAVVVAAVPGCRAVATSSAGVATALGYRDGERITPGEMLEMVGRIARAVDLPVTADLEAGYGDAAATAEAAIGAGAVGLNIEDRNGDVGAHVERVRAVHEAGVRLGVPLVVNARVDVFLPGGSGDVADAVARANAYLEAGADCAYPIGVSDVEVVGRLVAGIRGPVNIHAAPGGPTVAELARLGVRRISVGSLLHLTALGHARAAAAAALGAGTFAWAEAALPARELAARLP